MILVYLLSFSCFAVLILLLARNYVNHYCDEINNILYQITYTKKIEDTYKNPDSRLSKTLHQANKIIELLEQDYIKTQEENEAVKSLIANLSHQLKTPLSNIIMYSDILNSVNLSTEKQLEFTQKLKTETLKMDWLLTSLFKMSRLEAGAITFVTEPLHILETLTQSISSVFIKANEKKISIELKDFTDKKLLHNRKWTSEAITNILENAIKYSNQGSVITISLEERELYSIINIHDQGIGIRQSEYNNIFKRFYRSEQVKEKEGSGIGLYLARLILTKEGGNITVHSELNQGSCFCVFLQNCKN